MEVEVKEQQEEQTFTARTGVEMYVVVEGTSVFKGSFEVKIWFDEDVVDHIPWSQQLWWDERRDKQFMEAIDLMHNVSLFDLSTILT